VDGKPVSIAAEIPFSAPGRATLLEVDLK
jgi:hypothetical protein